jgi:hypothetical protein
MSKQDEDKQKTNNTTQKTETQKAYTDTASIYSLKYPESWSLVVGDDCCHTSHDPAEFSRTILISPSDVPKDANGYNIQVQASKTADIAKSFRDNWATSKATVQNVTINGNPAEYVKTEFKGDAEQYTDHTYLISKGESAVIVTFREKMNHPMVNNVWDASKHMDEYTDILNTVTFL